MTNADPPTARPLWTRRHLLSLQELTAAEIETILDEAARFQTRAALTQNRLDDLRGVTVANLFFEASTRTKTSFNLAAKRLGADTVDFTASTSSLSKGETFLDTALTIQAMGVQQMVVRHSTSETPALLAAQLKCSVLNAETARTSTRRRGCSTSIRSGSAKAGTSPA